MHSTHDKGNKFGIRLLLLVALMLLLLAHGAWGMEVDVLTGLRYDLNGDSKAIIKGIASYTGQTEYAIDNYVLTIPAKVFDGQSTDYDVVSIEGTGNFSGFAGLDIIEVDCTAATNLTSIGDLAFFNCPTLETVTLPDSVTSIGTGAFGFCAALENINMVNITSIESNAFYRTSLTTVNMPKVMSIGPYAFSGCTSLITVNMPNVTSIEHNAFIDCISLITVNMPNVKDIWFNAFFDCTSLTTISLDGTKLNDVENEAFRGTTALTTVYLMDADGGVDDTTRAARISDVYAKLLNGKANTPNVLYPADDDTLPTVTYLVDPANSGTVTGDEYILWDGYEVNFSIQETNPLYGLIGGVYYDEGVGNWCPLGGETTFIPPYGDTEVIAIFTRKAYNVNVEADVDVDVGGGIADCTVTIGSGTSEVVDIGDTVNITASSTVPCYEFVEWVSSSSYVQFDNQYDADTTFTIIDDSETEDDIILTAKFELITMGVRVSPYPAEGGTVGIGAPDDDFADVPLGQTVPLYATPSALYRFVGWPNIVSDIGIISESDPLYFYTAPDTKTYHSVGFVAQFVRNAYNVEVVSAGNGTVRIEGDIVPVVGLFGETLAIAATPDSGYTFAGWTSSSSFGDIPTATAYTVPSGDSYSPDTITLTATFNRIPPTPTYYTVHLTDIPADIGSVTGGGSFRYGDEASLKAVPAEGYRFIGWYKSETQMSTDAEYTFTVTESCELTAKFEKTDIPTPPQPIPLTFKATRGISYTLEQWTGGILNNATVSATRPKYMSVSADGTIKGLKKTTKKTTPVVTVTVNGETYKTTVIVVANKYTRKNPLKQDAPAVYTSANKLYYKGKFLYANVFLYNGTGVGVKGSDDLVLKIYDGDKQIAERTLDKPWTRSKNLKTGNHTTRLFKIKESELTGVRAKQFDLASGNIHAVLVGTTRNGYPVIPILADDGAKVAKSKADVLNGEFDDVVEDITEEDIEDVDIEDVEDIEDVGVEVE